MYYNLIYININKYIHIYTGLPKQAYKERSFGGQFISKHKDGLINKINKYYCARVWPTETTCLLLFVLTKTLYILWLESTRQRSVPA